MALRRLLILPLCRLVALSLWWLPTLRGLLSLWLLTLWLLALRRLLTLCRLLVLSRWLLILWRTTLRGLSLILLRLALSRYRLLPLCRRLALYGLTGLT